MTQGPEDLADTWAELDRTLGRRTGLPSNTAAGIRAAEMAINEAGLSSRSAVAAPRVSIDALLERVDAVLPTQEGKL